MTAITDPKEAKKRIKELKDAMIKRATELARKHVKGYRYTIHSYIATGAWIMLEHEGVKDKLHVTVRLFMGEVGFDGGIYNHPMEDADALIDMLTQCKAIADDYLGSIESEQSA